MTDIHCHVLPEMDDGSRSVEESVAMLEALSAQGVGCVAATPHFYAMENSPEEFLRRRETAVRRLRECWKPELPALRLGAEVYYYQGISQYEELERLSIEGTRLLLLEMPFERWTSQMLREVQEIQCRGGITVVLAHIERYLRWQDRDVWTALLEWGVLCQSNAEFFLELRTRRKALHMLREGRIHLLGSDSHDMESRPPRLGLAYSRLEARDRAVLEENNQKYLPDWKEAAG